MFKVMALLKRRPDLSLCAFIDHYEHQHALLGVRYLTVADRYMRHYLNPAPYPLDGQIAEPAYDVLTELWFADRGRYYEGMAQLGGPEAGRVIAADEERFLDRARSRLMFVEEHESEMGGRTADPDRDLRCCALLKRKPGMTMDEFIDYYETRHARLGGRFVTTMSRYRRLYLRPAPYPLDGSTVEAAYDVVVELSFPDQAALDDAGAWFADTVMRAVLGENEGRFVELESRQFVLMESLESVLR